MPVRTEDVYDNQMKIDKSLLPKATSKQKETVKQLNIEFSNRIKFMQKIADLNQGDLKTIEDIAVEMQLNSEDVKYMQKNKGEWLLNEDESVHVYEFKKVERHPEFIQMFNRDRQNKVLKILS